MAHKIIRLLIICFLTAISLNVANFFIYFIYKDNKSAVKVIKEEDRLISIYNQKRTNKNWRILSTWVVCGENSTDCQNESINDDAGSATTENQFNYYIEDVMNSNSLPFCPIFPPGLGPVKFDRSILQLDGLDETFSNLKPGGIFIPTHCIPRQRVAIIIPMEKMSRAWKNDIGTFLFYMHPFLMKQLPKYQVFVIVQGNPSEPYARGKLLNTGFMEAQRMSKNGWDCVIFHDANLIPTDTRNFYRCRARARRLFVDTAKTKQFGGAVAMTPALFKKLNGFSNLEWKNDGDYINMYRRLREWNLTIDTNVPYIGKYLKLRNFSDRNQTSKTSHANTPIYLIDGLSSLYYRVVKAELKRLYTFIQVDFRIID